MSEPKVVLEFDRDPQTGWTGKITEEKWPNADAFTYRFVVDGRAETIPVELVAFAVALQSRVDELGEERAKLIDWRASVTVALGRPSGMFYVDVPKCIKDLVTRVEEERLANVGHCGCKWAPSLRGPDIQIQTCGTHLKLQARVEELEEALRKEKP